jgi:hypothetical protein
MERLGHPAIGVGGKRQPSPREGTQVLDRPLVGLRPMTQQPVPSDLRCDGDALALIKDFGNK